jgi:ABC-type dipeptide/oligopeptide/nickel transport system permease component
VRDSTRPSVTQYLKWVGGVLTGDLGHSYFNQYSVTELVGQRFPTTIELTVLSMVIAVVLAVPAALVAVRRPGGIVDRIVTTFASAGMALPNFIVGVLLIVDLRGDPEVGRAAVDSGFVPLATIPRREPQDDDPARR